MDTGLGKEHCTCTARIEGSAAFDPAHLGPVAFADPASLAGRSALILQEE
jgi:hypothetical protein